MPPITSTTTSTSGRRRPRSASSVSTPPASATSRPWRGCAPRPASTSSAHARARVIRSALLVERADERRADVAAPEDADPTSRLVSRMHRPIGSGSRDRAPHRSRSSCRAAPGRRRSRGAPRPGPSPSRTNTTAGRGHLVVVGRHRVAVRARSPASRACRPPRRRPGSCASRDEDVALLAVLARDRRPRAGAAPRPVPGRNAS